MQRYSLASVQVPSEMAINPRKQQKLTDIFKRKKSQDTSRDAPAEKRSRIEISTSQSHADPELVVESADIKVSGLADARSTDISKSPYDSPVQPVMDRFPDSGGRRFSAIVYAKHPWVEYSASIDGVFCFPCRHFGGNSVRQGEKLGAITFIHRGFRKWKDMTNLLQQHSDSTRHKNSTVACTNFKANCTGAQKPIAHVLDAQRSDAIQENREHIKSLARAAAFLGGQGLAFRGDDESSDSPNKGNYVELLRATQSAILTPSFRVCSLQLQRCMWKARSQQAFMSSGMRSRYFRLHMLRL